ncbi:hypothetical protein [Aminipila terrae]|uniref:Uncharacterized protein n=1 Tax=Aminipila terrae TaxID=2697030 RepID=A0A6P1MHR7_9FIRM|nr:hypothetical protein [Aminipila terrae]QHI73281.1 hypothetical protein Ami3637_13640 [Aminipila terrae]
MIEYCQTTNPEQDIDNIVFRARIIWRDIVTWLGQYLITKTLNADAELEKEIINMLFSRVADFGGLIRTFFGDKAADDYTKLFSEYITQLISLIDALSEGNSSNANEIIQQIYQNDGQRIEFLTQINPYWDKSTLENYIYIFTDMIIREIMAFTSKQYKDSISIYERILSYSTSLGDFMAQGIKNYLIYNFLPPAGPPSVE